MSTKFDKFVIIGDWLCETCDGCTCGTPGGFYPHEQYCGVQNLIEVDRLLDEHEAFRATLAKVRAIVADPAAALVVDRIRAALEGKVL